VEIFLNRPCRSGQNNSFGPTAKISLALAKKFDVGDRTIRDIWGRRSWVDVTSPHWTEEEKAAGAGVPDSTATAGAGAPDSTATPGGVVPVKDRKRGRPRGVSNPSPPKVDGQSTILLQVLLQGRDGSVHSSHRAAPSSPSSDGHASSAEDSRETCVHNKIIKDEKTCDSEHQDSLPCQLSLPLPNRGSAPADVGRDENSAAFVSGSTAQGLGEQGGFIDPFDADWEQSLQRIRQQCNLA